MEQAEKTKYRIKRTYETGMDKSLQDIEIDHAIREFAQQIREEDKLPINFWTRLKEFIEDVQVNDPASEEEKEMIVHVCNEFKKQGGQ